MLVSSIKMIVLIIFHCLPSVPCCDGLLSALLQSKLYTKYHRLYFPYTRSKESFGKLKQALNVVSSLKAAHEKVVILYVDICPLHSEEFEVLRELREQGVSVQIKDHHPCDDVQFFKQQFDYCDLQTQFCATKVIAEELAEDDISLPSWMEDAVDFIQFSEYEGQDLELAGLYKVQTIANKLFDQNRHLNESRELGSVDRAYYILNAAMPNFCNWQFLLEATFESLGELETLSLQLEKSFEELEIRYKGLFEGELESVFNELSLSSYRNLKKEAESMLNKSLAVEISIDGVREKVIICFISIVKYGRSLEPSVRSALQEKGSSYAILINPPTETYYLSLRRASGEQDARQLVKVIKQLSGTSIGGGHPWASGATLTREQLERLFLELGATTLLPLENQ